MAYARLAADARARAAAAMRQGDVAGVSSVRIDVVRRDLELGARRSEEVRALLADINVHLDRARAHRLALDHYALLRRSFLAYERRVRPMLSGLDGLSPVLRKIETEEGMAFERLEGASERLAGLLTTMRAVRPPEDLAGVHATLVSALHLAEQACARRRLAVISKNVTLSREASSAAVGAMLLAAQARQTLVAHLFPPRIE